MIDRAGCPDAMMLMEFQERTNRAKDRALVSDVGRGCNSIHQACFRPPCPSIFEYFLACLHALDDLQWFGWLSPNIPIFADRQRQGP